MDTEETSQQSEAGLLPFDDGPSMEIMDQELFFGPGTFYYIGEGLSAAEFDDYVKSFNFGSIPPDFVVLHHTANPCTRHAFVPNARVWDGGEEQMSEAQIKQHRKGALDALRNYYRDTNGWQVGPHLFIDDRYIWLFTPMNMPGAHALADRSGRFVGNGYRAGGSLHYSIGIEVLGHYGRVRWDDRTARLVGQAVSILQRRLGTFQIRQQLGAGGISSHRDYNKPECPGNAITNQYYLDVISSAASQSRSGPAPVAGGAISVDSPILGPATGTLEQAVAFIRKSLPATSEYKDDVEKIMGYYWQYAPTVGIDPFLAAAQCIFETGGLTSQWAARPHRNPAGLGVRQEGGISFATWEDSVQAHIGQLLAFALRDDEANDAQRQMMQRNPRHSKIAPELRGTAKTLAGLNNRWTSDANYAGKLVSRAQAIRGA